MTTRFLQEEIVASPKSRDNDRYEGVTATYTESERGSLRQSLEVHNKLLSELHTTIREVANHLEPVINGDPIQTIDPDTMEKSKPYLLADVDSMNWSLERAIGDLRSILQKSQL